MDQYGEDIVYNQMDVFTRLMGIFYETRIEICRKCSKKEFYLRYYKDKALYCFLCAHCRSEERIREVGFAYICI